MMAHVQEQVSSLCHGGMQQHRLQGSLSQCSVKCGRFVLAQPLACMRVHIHQGSGGSLSKSTLQLSPL